MKKIIILIVVAVLAVTLIAAAVAGGINLNNDIEIVARAIYGEAADQPWIVKWAVANVIRNRLEQDPAQYGATWKAVILKPYAFTPFNQGNPRLRVLLDPPEGLAWKQSRQIAFLTILGMTPDITDGATHFYANSIKKPSWAARMKTTLLAGPMRFLREVQS